MSALSASMPGPCRYELRFDSLFDPGRGYAFPCDALGQVDMDGLTRHALANYLFARSVIGRDVATPRVRALSLN